MTTEPRHRPVQIRTGYPNPVGNSWVSVLGVDPPLVCLGVDDPDGTETTQWYAPGNALTAGGLRWRVAHTSAPTPLGRDAPPGAAGGQLVAVLEPIGRP
ncbi:hypothetical protein [Jiangella asiatica]|uniref:Uncharacterized protein n=1 Tax=Jiangella asiatica TaxID=2530372 RepID=A0A4R5DMA6_9ACTN|nr:hypothetical protein [Jiangella asiatica]TDE11803.1 hypothetical protein E1269_08550 [Jiangella asiatica]